jgi:two-component system OmpR family sensor kinase
MARLEGGQDRLLVTLQHLFSLRVTSLEDALDQASDLLVQALGADKVDVFLHDATIDSLVAVGTSNTPMGARQHAIGLDRLQVANGGPTVRVFLTGTSRLTGRADLDADELRGNVDALGIRSMMCVALPQEDERIGVVPAAAAAPDQFDTSDLRFLEVVSRWIGMVTQHAQLNARLAAEAAEAGRRAGVDELIAILAHDLRNHLSPIRGRVDLLQRWATRHHESTPLRYTEELSRSIDRLTRLVNELLDSARLQSGLLRWRPSTSTWSRWLVKRAARSAANSIPSWPAPMSSTRGRSMLMPSTFGAGFDPRQTC